MNQPSVVAIVLTANRPAMARQAVECFRRQTYANKRLLILDTGIDSAGYFGDYDEISHEWADLSLSTWSIGTLRNDAIARRCGVSEILIHWDDDDLSHPNRLAEQVQLLQSSGADAVGYNECLFWREQTAVGRAIGPGSVEWPGEAWLYTSTNPNEAIGSSLCYWRKTWERKPFQPTSQGEDAAFQIGLKVAAVTSMPVATFDIGKNGDPTNDSRVQPRLLCRIHAGNTSNAYTAENMRAAEWRRAAEWDSFCAKEFAR